MRSPCCTEVWLRDTLLKTRRGPVLDPDLSAGVRVQAGGAVERPGVVEKGRIWWSVFALGLSRVDRGIRVHFRREIGYSVDARLVRLVLVGEVGLL